MIYYFHFSAVLNHIWVQRKMKVINGHYLIKTSCFSLRDICTSLDGILYLIFIWTCVLFCFHLNDCWEVDDMKCCLFFSVDRYVCIWCIVRWTILHGKCIFWDICTLTRERERERESGSCLQFIVMMNAYIFNDVSVWIKNWFNKFL